jgi:hypothetical protein
VGTSQLGTITNINSAASNLTLQTNSTTAVTVDTSQNVGIGVTPNSWGGPFKAMQIGSIGSGAIYGRTDGVSQVYVGANTYYNGSNNIYQTSNYATYYAQSSGAHQWYIAPSGTAGNAITFTQAMTLDNSGNLGLGVIPSAWITANSTKAFQLSGGAAIYTQVNGSTYTVDISQNQYLAASTGNTYIVTNPATIARQQNGQHQWFVAPSGTAGTSISYTQAMTLDNSGNLSNTGSIISGTFTKATSYLWGVSGMYIGSGTENGHIDQASHGTGTVTTYIGNATITTVSDARLKENVVDTTIKAVDTLNKLRVVDHTWNDPSDQCENNRNSRGTWVGLIAQEAQPIIPWLVNKPPEDVDKEGNPQYWHMDYGYSVPLLIKAIQELSAEVTALKAKIGV